MPQTRSGDDLPTRSRPMVVAHRGASGYVPEHTLVAKGIAHAMGSDAIEQDVIATKDHELIVLHDIHLDTVTDVASRFPGRHRSDMRFYAIDFTLEEIRSLHVFERFNRQSKRPVFPNRYQVSDDGFRIVTLEEELRFLQNLNRTLGREASVYPEIKHPAWHLEQGCDLPALVIETLRNHGYHRQEDACYVQCFDDTQVLRIRNELGYEGRLVQLIDRGHDETTGSDYNRMKSREGLRELSETVDAIGPRIDSILTWHDRKLETSDLVTNAHDFGLEVCPWTVRADSLPDGCETLGELVGALNDAGVDGMFSDQPDQVLRLLA